jgi:hypothetical protein
LQRLLQSKEEREKKDEAMHIKDIERLVTEEIEMLKVVLYLVCRNNDMHTHRGNQQQQKEDHSVSL